VPALTAQEALHLLVVEVDLVAQPVQLTQLRQVVVVCMAVAVALELTNLVQVVQVAVAL
jgi:hypothetical protein